LRYNGISISFLTPFSWLGGIEGLPELKQQIWNGHDGGRDHPYAQFKFRRPEEHADSHQGEHGQKSSDDQEDQPFDDLSHVKVTDAQEP